MKIYNRKGFFTGIGALLLAASDIYVYFAEAQHDVFDIVKSLAIVAFLLIAGVVLIVRSQSKSATHDDKLDQRDERNQLISLKANALALKILIGIIAVLALVVAFVSYPNSSALTQGVVGGLMITLGVTFWVWVGTTWYYHRKL